MAYLRLGNSAGQPISELACAGAHVGVAYATLVSWRFQDSGVSKSRPGALRIRTVTLL